MVICRARADTVLPLEWPILAKDGKTQIKEIAIKKGQKVTASIYAANRCKEIWGEDAEEWKPERWLSPLPPMLEEARIPGVYAHLYVQSSSLLQGCADEYGVSRMTFAAGTRSCM